MKRAALNCRASTLDQDPATQLCLRSAGSHTSVLLSCTSCHGHSLTLRGVVVQCDDCCTIQPVIVDRPRIVQDGVVVQELAARYFPTGDAALAALGGNQ